MDEKNNADRYVEYIKSYILPFIDYYELQTSYDTDMVYAKGILNRLHEAMINIYGGERFGEDETDNGFVIIPGVVYGVDSKKICLALLELDLSSSGEHWGTSFLCKYGVIAQDDSETVSNNKSVLKSEIKEIHTMYIPYDYCFTALIPGDIHVERHRLPDAINQVLKDFRNHHAELLFEQDMSDFDGIVRDETDKDEKDFTDKMAVLLPKADIENVRRVIKFARELAEEGSYSKNEYLSAVFTEYDLAVRQYGENIVCKLLNVNKTINLSPSNIQGAAKHLSNGATLKQIPRLAIIGKCDISKNDKPSVLDKIREAPNVPKKPKKANPARNKKKEPEH